MVERRSGSSLATNAICRSKRRICLYLYVLLKALALHFVGLVNNYVRCSCSHASVYSHYPVRDHSMPSKDADFTVSHLAGGFSIIL